MIVVDPGHGGIDDGTRAGYRFLEKDINLQLGFALRAALQRLGAQVMMTRETDTSLSRYDKVYNGRHREDLARRVQIINENAADLFVSVHCNACPEYPGARGSIVYYSQASPVSKQMAESTQARLNRINLANLGAAVRPHAPVGADYFVLHNTQVPGILLEAGYLTNTVDLRILTTREFQESLAHAVSMGIADWRRLPPPNPEPPKEGKLAILIKPDLSHAGWLEYLDSTIPLTFVLEPADCRFVDAARLVNESGHNLALSSKESGGHSTGHGSDLVIIKSEPERSITVLYHAQSSRTLAAADWRGDSADELSEALQLVKTQEASLLLIDLMGSNTLDMPGELLLQIAKLLQETNLQPVFVNDIYYLSEHHGP